jgi:DNA-binding PadR family transcriptional regulator
MSARKNKEKGSGALARLLRGGSDVPSLSAKEALILRMLVPKRQMFGQQMVDESEGQLGRGTVYVTLARMQQKKYVESWEEERPPGAVGLPRRLYKITGEGQRVLNAWERAALVLQGALTGGGL